MTDTAKGNATKARIFAMVLDNLIATILALFATAIVPGVNPYVKVPTLVLVYLGYFLVTEGLWSQTIGKKLFGLRVVRVDGAPCGFRESAIRTAFRLLEVNPVLLGVLPGGIAVLVTERNQRLGDVVAGTLVVDAKQRKSGMSN